jgi:hypothetical protein
MFTGALASSYYGTPRTTMDIDIIIAITKKEIKTLIKTLTKTNIQAKTQQFQETSETGYNIVPLKDTKTPYTIDFIILPGPLEKVPCTILDEPTYIQQPSNLILAKLRMIKATQDPEKSGKDKSDIRSILRHTNINLQQLKHRARKENTITILEQLIHKK